MYQHSVIMSNSPSFMFLVAGVFANFTHLSILVKMPSWEVYNSQNQEMVEKFTRLAIISSKEVENAFRCVSRAAFVSKELLKESFVDAPIRGSPHIHMSAPHMYAAILEDLELEPGQ